MIQPRILPLALLLAIGLAACGQDEPPTADAETAPGVGAGADAAADQAGDGAQDVAATDGKPAFDIGSVPRSTVALGGFPYIQLPRGYEADKRSVIAKDFARFPFWVDGEVVWVEGRFEGNELRPADGKAMSEYEVQRNFEAIVKQMGGVKLSEGRIPRETLDSWGSEITQGFNGAIGDVWSEPVHTYVVRRDEGNIWIHLVTNSAQGWYLIGQEQGFEQTASLLPASELNAQIDSTGKVALQVNFATDRTEILPESQPQIDQVVELLQQHPELTLGIEGHTDDTGDAGHNLRLSEGRANAVVKALVARGIDAARLTSAGFGSTRPVADNGSEEGKARNRRVELVKR